MKLFSKSFILCMIISLSVMLFTGCGCSQEIKVESIAFDSSVVDLFVGDIYDPQINILPSKAQNKKIYYRVDNPKNASGAIVKVLDKKDGDTFVATQEGEATLYATSVYLGAASTVTQSVRVFNGQRKLDTPTGIKYDGEKVVWDTVTYTLNNKDYNALGYIVNLNGQNREISANTYLEGLQPGVVNTIKVKATENGSNYVSDSDFSSEIKVYILNAPTNVTRTGTLVSWDAVEFAGSYDIFVNGELYYENITETSTNIDFEQSGNYVINIRANPQTNSEFKYSSALSASLSIEKLDSVQNISISDNLVAWNEVIKAVEYRVVIENESQNYVFDTGVYTSFDISGVNEQIASGDYKLSIIAISNATSGVNSNKSEPIDICKLAAPTNLRVENNLLVWDSVDGAVGYALTVNGGEIIDVLDSYSLPEGCPAGMYKFKMIAYGDGETTLTSNWTSNENEYVAYKLAAPQNVTNNETIITNDLVENSYTYEYYDVADEENIIKLGESNILSFETDENNAIVSLYLDEKVDYRTFYNLDDLYLNCFKIKVKSIGENGGNYFDSNLSDAYAEFYRLFEPEQFSIVYAQGLFVYTNGLVIDAIQNEKSKELYNSIPLYSNAGFVIKIRYQQMENGKLVDRFVKRVDGEGDGITKEEMSRVVGGDVYISMCYAGNGSNVIDSNWYGLRLAESWSYDKLYNFYIINKWSDESVVIPKMNAATDLSTNGTTLTFNSSNEGEEIFRVYADGVMLPVATSLGRSIDLNNIVYNNNQFNMMLLVSPNDNSDFDINEDETHYYGTSTFEDKFRFDSNAVEFTVSRLNAPQLSIENGYVCWSAVEGASSYQVYVNGVLDNTAEVTCENGTYKYYCNNYSSEVLVIQVVSVVSNSTDIENLKINSLRSGSVTLNRLVVSNYSIEDDNLIVETSEVNVQLNFVATNIETGDVIRETFDDLTINLPSVIKVAGDYNISFYLSLRPDVVQNKLDSIFYGLTNPITIKVLEIPMISYNMSSYKVSYQANANASGYKLVYKVKGNDEITFSNTFITNEIDLSTYKGFLGDTTYVVTVIAVGNGENIVSSYIQFEDNYVEFIGMQEPTNLAGIVNGENFALSWDSVDNATYKLFVNGNEIASINTNAYNYPLNSMSASGDYVFSVRALSNNGSKAPSKYSEVFAVTKLELPDAELVDGEVKLNNFNGEISNINIKVYDNGQNLVYTENYNKDTISLDDIVEIGLGVYSIDIQYVGDNSNYISSGVSTLSNISRMASVTDLSLNASNKRLEWTSLSGIEAYKVVYENELGDITYEIVTTNYTTIFEQCPIGTISAKVYSVGRDEGKINAMASNIVSFNKLNSPTNLSIVNGNLIFDKIQGIDNYSIRIVKNDVESFDSYVYNIDGYQLDMTDAGNYSISVCAKGNYVTNINSSYSNNLDIIKLDKVENVSLADCVITWDEVENANNYKLVFNGISDVEIVVDTNAYEIELDKFVSGSYDLSIFALGDNETVFSGISTMLYNFMVAISKPTNVAFNADKELVWDEVENASLYQVSITSENYETIICDSLINKITLPTTLNSGEYAIYVKALGNSQNVLDSVASNALNVTKLRTPFGVTHSAGVITVSELQGIQDYVIVITDEEQNVVTKAVNTLNLSASYEFPNAGVYTISVYSRGNYIDTIDSSLSTELQVIRLQAPNLSIENNIVSWAENEYAAENNFGYYVTISKDGNVIYQNSTLGTSVKLDVDNFAQGSYEVSVKVLAGVQDEYLESSTSSISSISKFNKPIISNALSNNKVCWTLDLTPAELLVVSGYEVKIVDKNGMSRFATINDVNVKEFEVGDNYEAGIYKISVRVLGDGHSYIASQFSDEKEICKLAKLKGKVQRQNPNDSASAYELVWDSITGATSYIVVINDTNAITVESTHLVLDNVSQLIAGENNIRIMANGDNTYYVNSKVGDATTFNVIDSADANLKVENGVLVWDSVENAKLYLLQINDAVVNVSTNTTYELQDIFNYGDYTIKIKVIAIDNEGYEGVIINSKYSSEINGYKLKAPKSVKIVDGMLEFDEVEYHVANVGDSVRVLYEIVYGNRNGFYTMGENYKLTIHSDMINIDSEIKYKAIGDSYNLNSNWSNEISQIYGKELPAVQNVYMQNGTLYWDSVENAAGYKLTATLQGVDVGAELFTASTSFERPFYNNLYDIVGAQYNVSVVAVGTHDSTGNTSAFTNSKATNYAITYLKRAENIESKEGVLTWEGSSENGYEILIDSVKKGTDVQQYKFEEEATGKHIIRVRLKGNGEEIIDGSWSNEAIIYKIDTPESYTATSYLKDGNIAWKTSTNFLNDYGVYSIDDIENLGLFGYANLLINNETIENTVIAKTDIETTIDGDYFYCVITDYLDDLAAGTYKFRLKNVGITGSNDATRFINSVYSNEFSAIVLTSPEDVRVENGVLRWSNVPNNNGYIVHVGELEYNIVKSQNNDTCLLDLNDLPVGSYEIRIRTLGDSEYHITSKLSDTIYVSVLSTPVPMVDGGNAIAVEDGMLIWQAVEGAIGYNIVVVNTINDARNTFEMVSFNEKDGKVYYELPETLPAGNYDVTIMTVGNGSSTISSKYTTTPKRVVKLNMVTNFGNTLGKLSFKQVINSEDVPVGVYKIYIKSSLYSLDNKNEFEIIARTTSTNEESATIKVDEFGVCYYELPEYIPNGSLTIKVKAVGTTDDINTVNSYVNSSYTNSMTATKLETVNDLYIQDGVVKWTYGNLGRSGFYLAIEDDGVLELDENTLITTYSAEFPSEKSAGTYMVCVKAVGNTVTSDEQESRYLCSNLSQQIIITKLPNANGFSIEDGMLVWEGVENASTYELNFYKENQNKITIKSKVYDNNYRKYVYEPIGITADEQEKFQSGNYNRITIRALGGANFINSQEIELTNIYKIARPYSPDVISSNNSTLKLRWQISTYTIGGNLYFVKKYRIKLVSANSASFTEFIDYDNGDMTASTTELTSSTIFEYDLSKISISSGSYTLSMQACALPRFNGEVDVQDVINSDYSVNVSITKPNPPSNLVYDDGIKAFTWKAPTIDSSLTVRYEVAYLYSAKEFVNITDNEFANMQVDTFITSDNYFYPTKLGYYKVAVKAIVSGSLSSDYVAKNNYMYYTYSIISQITNETDRLKAFIRGYGADCTHKLFEGGDGSSENPYKIKNAEQLSNLNYYYLSENYFELINDINLNGTNLTIGTSAKPFGGTLNGKNLTIRNLVLNGTNNSIGLFAYVNGATIKNLKLNASVTVTRTAETYIGLLVGYAEDLNLENILIDGSISQISNGNISATFYIGGAVGYAKGESTYFNKVKNMATITATNTSTIAYVGGIVGRYSASYGENSGINGCGNEASISGTIVGGIVGYANCPISNSYNTGTIKSEVSKDAATYAGGIVGRTIGSNVILVVNAYNAGSVSATSTNNKDCYAGGLLGYGNVDVEYFYNSGAISTINKDTSRPFYGWLIGYNANNGSSANYCYNINEDILAIIAAGTAINSGCETINANELISNISTYLNNKFTYSSIKHRIILVVENELLS